MTEAPTRTSVALVHCLPGTELDRAHVPAVVDDLHRFVAQEVIGAETPIDTVVLDLSTIELVDAAGIVALLRFKGSLTGLALDLRLTCASPFVRQTIDTLGVTDRLGLED